MTSSSPGSSAVLERQGTTQLYPEARVIVLDDDVNTFQHVVDCLRKIIPGMRVRTTPGTSPTELMDRVLQKSGAGRWSRPSFTTSSFRPKA